MEIKLREYQSESVNKVFEEWAKGHNKVLVQQPTGAGKSLIIASIVKSFVDKQMSVLFVAHKVELLHQMKEHLFKWTETEFTVLANKQHFTRVLNSQYQIASIQGLTRTDLNSLPFFDLIVFDECHHCAALSYVRLFEYYRKSFILGVTATPVRPNGESLRLFQNKEGNEVEGFTSLIQGVPVEALQDMGYLSKFKVFAAKNLVDPELAGIKKIGGDYSEKDVGKLVEEQLINDEIVRSWIEFAENKKTVLYPPTVKLSKAYCKEFNERGYKASHLDSKTPHKEREQILSDFREGQIKILCQHSIIIEGVDVPDVECVQFVRPTASIVLWFQAIGRSLRPAPGKEHAIIIDHTTTHEKLAWVDIPIDWSLDGELNIIDMKTVTCLSCQTVSKRKDVLKNHGRCPVCDRLLIAPTTQPSKKEKEAPIIETVVYDTGVKLEEIKREKLCDPAIVRLINEILDTQKERGYKKGWCVYRILEIPGLKYTELQFAAFKLGYRDGWAYYKATENNIPLR